MNSTVENAVNTLAETVRSVFTVKNVTGTSEEAPRIETDTRSPEVQRLAKERTEQNRQLVARIQAVKNARLEELEAELNYLNTHHQSTKEKIGEIKNLIQQYSNELLVARQFLKETDGVGGFTSQRAQAQRDIEKHEPLLEKQKKYMKIREEALKNLESRIKKFPINDLKKLRAVRVPTPMLRKVTDSRPQHEEEQETLINKLLHNDWAEDRQ